MMPAGILAGLKQLSPNMDVVTQQNEIEIVIPREDIINAVKQGMPENMRQFVSVEYTERGVVMKIKLL